MKIIICMTWRMNCTPTRWNSIINKYGYSITILIFNIDDSLTLWNSIAVLSFLSVTILNAFLHGHTGALRIIGRCLTPTYFYRWCFWSICHCRKCTKRYLKDARILSIKSIYRCSTLKGALGGHSKINWAVFGHHPCACTKPNASVSTTTIHCTTLGHILHCYPESRWFITTHPTKC